MGEFILGMFAGMALLLFLIVDDGEIVTIKKSGTEIYTTYEKQVYKLVKSEIILK